MGGGGAPHDFIIRTNEALRELGCGVVIGHAYHRETQACGRHGSNNGPRAEDVRSRER